MKDKFNYVTEEELTKEKIKKSIATIPKLKEQIDDTAILFKRRVEERLIRDPRIIHVLDNPNLDITYFPRPTLDILLSLTSLDNCL